MVHDLICPECENKIAKKSVVRRVRIEGFDDYPTFICLNCNSLYEMKLILKKKVE